LNDFAAAIGAGMKTEFDLTFINDPHCLHLNKLGYCSLVAVTDLACYNYLKGKSNIIISARYKPFYNLDIMSF
jgi:hypothetical protein